MCRTRFTTLKPLALAISLTMASVGSLAYTQEVFSQTQATQTFNIPAGNLDQVLKQFGLSAGVELYANGDQVKHLRSNGLQGQYTPSQGLAQLLANTGLIAETQDNGAIRIRTAAAVHNISSDGIQLEAVRVLGAYDSGLSRDEKGYDDVYDLDLSTAYMGKEEIERYKGVNPADLLNGVAGVYSGDSRNSGALDPNIRGIQGPGRVPLLIDGTEQALTVWRGYYGATNRSYIDPNLIGGVTVYKGPGQVRDIKTGIGGAVSARTLSAEDVVKDGESFGMEVMVEAGNNSVKPRIGTLYTGQNVADVDRKEVEWALVVTPKYGNKLLSNGDKAYRVAMGYKQPNYDVLMAYAYRKRGNYYTGKNNAGYYSDDPDIFLDSKEMDRMRVIAHYYKPGYEIPNTSNQMESWLLKTNAKLSADQKLSFTYRHSDSTFGEIMPSAIPYTVALQYPLSEITAKAYSLDYSYQPEHNKWIDFRASIWRTETLGDTYNSGGRPNYFPFMGDTTKVVNAGVANTNNTRNGITLSNKTALTDSLDLTLGGNFQHEKLRTSDTYDVNTRGAWRMFPREGTRQEWEGSFNVQWRPTKKLTLDAGMRYMSYWSFDDFLDKYQDVASFSTSASGRVAVYYTRSEAEKEAWKIRNIASSKIQNDIFNIGWTDEEIVERVEKFLETWVGNRNQVEWQRDEYGKFSRATNPCLNGFLDSVEGLVDYHGLPPGNKCFIAGGGMGKVKDVVAEKIKDHAWVPNLSVAYELTSHDRAYIRYNEMIRFPSMFESTIGFSSSLNPFKGISPEHSYNYEIGYVRNMLDLFPNAQYADFKIAYFRNYTKNVIERDFQYYFHNIDSQTIKGLELQARYDNGVFFTDLGISYLLDNKVCDEHTAIFNDPTWGRMPNCVQDGFSGGYLITQAMPKLSSNLTLGGRFLDRKLEIGTRLRYHTKFKNKDLEHFKSITNQNLSVQLIPFSWGSTLLTDAYVHYAVNKDISVELVGTNITNQYYSDPGSRAFMPAPGRTVKLNLTARF